MYKFAKPKIVKGDKLIIGLGDSFTQGVGAYSDETYIKWNGKVDVHTQDYKLIKEHYEGSWVKQLCDNHMPGWVPVNLGHAGTGNRSAIKELYLNPQVRLDLASEVIVIYMLSGLERFDFAIKEQSEEHHFYSMWPNPQDPNSTNKKLWECYADQIYSEQFIATELLINLLDIQTYCRANNYKLIVTSAFDMRVTKEWMAEAYPRILPFIKTYHDRVIEQFDWNLMLYPQGYTTIIEMLSILEGQGREIAKGRWFRYYTSMPTPGTYITNCAHPTRKGHAVIAEELYKSIVQRDYL
jgi:lysophospholipase L1-like esterase